MKTIWAVIALTLSLFMAPAFAEGVNLDGLTDLQKAEAMKVVAQLKAQGSNGSANLETAAKWGEIIKGLGVGLAETAKELGVAANDFVQTPVGKWAAALIIWKIAGSAIVHIALGSAIWFVAIPAWFLWWRNPKYVVEKKQTGVTWFGLIPAYNVTKTPYVPERHGSAEEIWWARFTMSWVGSIALLITGAITLFNGW